MPTEKQLKYWESLRGKKNPEHSKFMTNFRTGKHHSKATIKKLSIAKLGNKNPMKRPEVADKVRKALKGQLTPWNTGDKSYNWKGDNVGYGGVHLWVRKNLGEPKKCKHCGIEKGRFEWANKDHKYKRNLLDWLRLCPKCHRRYDRDILKIKIGRY